MRNLFILFIGLISFSAFSQTVKVEESSESFRGGRFNAMVITIPHADVKTLEKELKNEMKSWDGKYNSSKGEMTTTQGTIKALGDRPFDAIAKIIESKKGDHSIALAINLGGAYLARTDHGEQYDALAEKMRLFGLRVSREVIENEAKDQAKILAGMVKSGENLEKEKSELEKSIEDYLKRIEENKKKIEENIKAQEDMRKAIIAQKGALEVIENKKKDLK
ncbi:MAG: hypothetical protein ACSHXL_01675 [Bacteroidota bacterium]